MKILLVAVVVLAIGQVPTAAAVEEHRDNSLLVTLLEQAGFSEFCISDALDQCSKQEKEGHVTSLMEEIIQLLKTSITLHNTTTQDNSPPCHCKDLLDSGDSGSGLQDVFPSTDRPSHTTTQDNSPPRHCKDLLDSGDSGKGLRDVFPDPERPQHSVEVYCDHTIDGGGWTVFQRRTNDSTRQSFERSWNDYKEGFGDKTGEFWLGLESLHQFTSRGDHEIRIDLDDYDGKHRWAKYGMFYVSSQDTNYRLTIGRYSGDAGDAMGFYNGSNFSTHDADHDASSLNCAAGWRAGWWYMSCSSTNLNGYHHVGRYSAIYTEGIAWSTWRGPRYSLRRTTMMVRPAL